jgi:signal transduction histidine kinase
MMEPMKGGIVETQTIDLQQAAVRSHDAALAKVARLEAERRQLSLDALVDPKAAKRLKQVEGQLLAAQQEVERGELAKEEAARRAKEQQAAAAEEAKERLDAKLVAMRKERNRLLERARKNPDEMSTDDLEEIANETRRISSLTSDLLALTGDRRRYTFDNIRALLGEDLCRRTPSLCSPLRPKLPFEKPWAADLAIARTTQN